MRKLLTLLLLTLVLITPVHGQNLRLEGYSGGRPRYSKRLFWTEVGTYTAANLADGITTVRNIHHHLAEMPFPQGGQQLLGPHPTALRYSFVMGGIEVGSALLAHRLERSDTRFLRGLGHGLMLLGTGTHGYGAINNVTTPDVR